MLFLINQVRWDNIDCWRNLDSARKLELVVAVDLFSVKLFDGLVDLELVFESDVSGLSSNERDSNDAVRSEQLSNSEGVQHLRVTTDSQDIFLFMI